MCTGPGCGRAGGELDEHPFVPLLDYRAYPEDEMMQRARDFLADLKRRRTVRHFSSRPVPRAVINHCLSAATTSGGPDRGQCLAFGMKRSVVGQRAAAGEVRKVAHHHRHGADALRLQQFLDAGSIGRCAAGAGQADQHVRLLERCLDDRAELVLPLRRARRLVEDGPLRTGRGRHVDERTNHLHRAVIVDDDRHVLAGPDREKLAADEAGALGHADGRRRHACSVPITRRFDRQEMPSVPFRGQQRSSGGRTSLTRMAHRLPHSVPCFPRSKADVGVKRLSPFRLNATGRHLACIKHPIQSLARMRLLQPRPLRVDLPSNIAVVQSTCRQDSHDSSVGFLGSGALAYKAGAECRAGSARARGACVTTTATRLPSNRRRTARYGSGGATSAPPLYSSRGCR